jgi:hypothetical protein
MKSFKAEGSQDDKSNDSFVARLATKIIDNLQVVVNKVHLRLEDFTTNPDVRRLSILLTFEEVSIYNRSVFRLFVNQFHRRKLERSFC